MSNTNLIISDIQSLEVNSGFVSLYELEWSSSTTLYFHPGVSSEVRVAAIVGTQITLNTSQTIASGITLTFSGYTEAGVATTQQTTASASVNNSTTLNVASATNLKVGMTITGTGILNIDYSPIVFNGNTYYAMPIELSNFDIKSEGAMSRPRLLIANIESILRDTSLFQNADDGGTDGISSFKIDDLIGKRFIQRRTLEKYLTIDPSTVSTKAVVELPKRTYVIDRIKTKTSSVINFELVNPADLEGISIPHRSVIGKYCPWEYQGLSFTNPVGACTWPTGGDVTVKLNESGTLNTKTYRLYFTENDEPILWWGLVHDTDGSVKSGYTYADSTQYPKGRVLALSDGSGGFTYWRANILISSSNTTDPSPTNTNWQQCRLWRPWHSSSSFAVHATHSERNDYVAHPCSSVSSSTDTSFTLDSTATIYRAVVASTGKTPGPFSDHWTRGDFCGKILSSCKKRFQATIGSGTNITTVPLSETDSAAGALPFGGFPGSRKHR
ncbi:MAG: hypothetical protein CMA04_007620 [Methanobacteriota archaeon]|nr:MAG: hypothetical protein CMA04_007620 [Euryarchaeota archaeon]|tara:strand:- start:7573 stop:9069 length:1497 start_codon:yes stop_codon:yes gene_type:complete